MADKIDVAKPSLHSLTDALDNADVGFLFCPYCNEWTIYKDNTNIDECDFCHRTREECLAQIA